jgi:hypothetical protein
MKFSFFASILSSPLIYVLRVSRQRQRDDNYDYYIYEASRLETRDESESDVE